VTDDIPSRTASAAGRPVTIAVTIAVVAVYISAFANVLLGILILLSRYQVARADVLPVSLLGAAVILFGLLLVAVASGLSRGSRLSRVLATVYLGILIALNAATIATTDGWDWSTAVQLAVQLIVVVLLWAPPGSRRFARDRPAAA
jgi:CDP-diglyceride synthetase